MNGFRYDSEQKKITIEDDTSVVNWEFVEQETANEAGKMFNNNESCKDIDAFLLTNGCKRYWRYKSEHPKTGNNQ